MAQDLHNRYIVLSRHDNSSVAFYIEAQQLVTALVYHAITGATYSNDIIFNNISSSNDDDNDSNDERVINVMI